MVQSRLVLPTVYLFVLGQPTRNVTRNNVGEYYSVFTVEMHLKVYIVRATTALLLLVNLRCFPFFAQSPGMLGVILGAVGGFLVGMVVVALAYVCYSRRSKQYSPAQHEANGRAIGYVPVAQTPVRATLLQPKGTKRDPAAEQGPETGAGETPDGENRIRITEPYEADAVHTPTEESSDNFEQDELSELSAPEAEKKIKRPKVGKRLSLPSKFRSAELVHHSPEEFLRQKSAGLEQACQLEFSLFYDTGSRELHVTVIQATAIPTPDQSFLRLPNGSVKMRILPEMVSWQWTRKVARTSNPAFNETFIVPGFVHNKLRECTVHFVVLDFDDVQETVYVVGEVFMPLSEVRANRLEKSVKRVNPVAF